MIKINGKIVKKRFQESLMNDKDWKRVEKLEDLIGVYGLVEAIFNHLEDDQAVKLLDAIEAEYNIDHNNY